MVYLPSGIVAFVVYFLAIQLGGAALIAQANVIVYAFLAISVTLFSLRELKFKFRFELITGEEKELIQKVLKRLSRF